MNILTKITIAAAVLAVCSIAEVRAADLRITLDPSVSMYERASVLRVTNEWNVALKGVRRIEIGEGGTVLAMAPGAPVLGKERCEGGLTEPGKITLYQGCMAKGSLLPFLRHEFGHLLGVPHMAHTVMDPTCCYDWQSVDERSAEVARALNGFVVARAPR